MAGAPAHLLADGGDTAGREAGGARADELGKAATELEFGFCGVEGELVFKEAFNVVEVFKVIPAIRI